MDAILGLLGICGANCAVEREDAKARAGEVVSFMPFTCRTNFLSPLQELTEELLSENNTGAHDILCCLLSLKAKFSRFFLRHVKSHCPISQTPSMDPMAGSAFTNAQRHIMELS